MKPGNELAAESSPSLAQQLDRLRRIDRARGEDEGAPGDRTLTGREVCVAQRASDRDARLREGAGPQYSGKRLAVGHDTVGQRANVGLQSGRIQGEREA